MNTKPLDRLAHLPPSVRDDRSRRIALLRRINLRLSTLRVDAGPRVRRALDIAGASFGFLLILPVLVAAAIGIKATSKGPMLFKQERIGKNGRRFNMLKFRTMRTDAEALKDNLAQAHGAAATGGLRFKMKRDPRITRIGAVLRKLSIDELPQLWNVIRGDMTLVGPRPAVWREVAHYDPRALRRLEVPQGLTCLWQIGGRSDLSFDEQVALDIEYIDRVKPLDEIKIVAKTVPAVIKGKGAY